MIQTIPNKYQKEFEECCESFISIISQYIPKKTFIEKLNKLLLNPKERTHFYEILSAKNLPLPIQIKIMNHPLSFHLAKLRVPQKLFSTKTPQNNTVLYENEEFINFIHNFFSIRGNPAVPSDLLRIIQNLNLLNPHDFSTFCDSINWVAEKYPRPVLRVLGIPATIGWMTNKSVASYTKVEYPIGYPARSGQQQKHSILCNYNWVACENQSEDTRRHATIIKQVNETLQDIEDQHSYLDIQIARNINVLVYFLTKGPQCTGFTSPIVLNEMNEIYGPGGGLILELYKKNPEKYKEKIIERLRQRGVNLRNERISKLEHFATELERVLPPQRSKYQSVQQIKNAYPDFSEVGKTPILFIQENVTLIGQLVDIYIDIINNSLNDTNSSSENLNEIGNLIHSSSNPQLNQLSSSFSMPNHQIDRIKYTSRMLISHLRSPPDKPLPATFSFGACLATAALLTTELAVVTEIDQRTKTGVKIAVEIGITSETMHGHWQLFKIAIDTIMRKKWTEGAREMSGTFFEINLIQAIKIIRTINLFIKCLSIEAQSENDPPLLLINFNDNHLYITDYENPDYLAGLDLTQVE